MHFLKLFEVTWKLVCLQDVRDFLNMYKCCPLCRLLELVLRSSPEWVALARLPLLNEWERRVANAQKPRALLCCCYTKHALGRARRASSAVSHHDFHADKMLFKNFQAHPTIGITFLFFKEPELGWLQKWMPLKKINFRTLIVLTARWQCKQQASVGKHAARFGPSGRLGLSRPFLWPGSTGTRHQDEPPPPP